MRKTIVKWKYNVSQVTNCKIQQTARTFHSTTTLVWRLKQFDREMILIRFCFSTCEVCSLKLVDLQTSIYGKQVLFWNPGMNLKKCIEFCDILFNTKTNRARLNSYESLLMKKTFAYFVFTSYCIKLFGIMRKYKRFGISFLILNLFSFRNNWQRNKYSKNTIVFINDKL